MERQRTAPQPAGERPVEPTPSVGRGPVAFFIGDLVRLGRPHPCGGETWRIDRLGADIGLRCSSCGRHVLLDRPTLERRLTGFVERGDAAMSAALAPVPRDAAR
jgi:hypothetical protein